MRYFDSILRKLSLLHGSHSGAVFSRISLPLYHLISVQVDNIQFYCIVNILRHTYNTPTPTYTNPYEYLHKHTCMHMVRDSNAHKWAQWNLWLSRSLIFHLMCVPLLFIGFLFLRIFRSTSYAKLLLASSHNLFITQFFTFHSSKCFADKRIALTRSLARSLYFILLNFFLVSSICSITQILCAYHYCRSKILFRVR